MKNSEKLLHIGIEGANYLKTPTTQNKYHYIYARWKDGSHY